MRVKTVLGNTKTNLFALARLNFFDAEHVSKEYVFDIKDCVFHESEKGDLIMRLDIQGRRFFASRQRTLVYNEELLKAVFNDKVERIECLR